MLHDPRKDSNWKELVLWMLLQQNMIGKKFQSQDDDELVFDHTREIERYFDLAEGRLKPLMKTSFLLRLRLSD